MQRLRGFFAAAEAFSQLAPISLKPNAACPGHHTGKLVHCYIAKVGGLLHAVS